VTAGRKTAPQAEQLARDRGGTLLALIDGIEISNMPVQPNESAGSGRTVEAVWETVDGR
jgi:hypothetical protein